MTRSSFIFRRGVAVAAVFCGVPAGAQEQHQSQAPISFGMGLGVAATPGGGIGSLGMGTLELGTPWRNIDFRLDGSVTSWSGRRLTSLTTNLVYSHRVGSFVPYLLGGIGGYAQSGVGASFGVNGGVGIKTSFWRLQPFIEIREHVWSADRTRRATPLTLGIMF
jgi:hypothetical protein